MDDVLKGSVVPAPVRRASEGDRRLIRDLLAGEASAIASLDSWIRVVLRTDFQGLLEDWEDLLQEIRLRVIRNLRGDRFRGRSELRTYVYRIARNTCIDARRRAAGRRELPGAVLEPLSDRAAAQDGTAGLISRDLLRKLLLAATPAERHLLEMVHAEHLSYAEIARQLGVPEGTIKARVFRCRDHMLALRRRLLRPEGT